MISLAGVLFPEYEISRELSGDPARSMERWLKVKVPEVNDAKTMEALRGKHVRLALFTTLQGTSVEVAIRQVCIMRGANGKPCTFLLLRKLSPMKITEFVSLGVIRQQLANIARAV